MTKHIKWTYEQKLDVAKMKLSGKTILEIQNKYPGINRTQPHVWAKKLQEGSLQIDNRGRRQKCELSDEEILKKCCAQLQIIRSKPPISKNIK